MSKKFPIIQSAHDYVQRLLSEKDYNNAAAAMIDIYFIVKNA